MARKHVPDATKTLVLLEAGYKCANPSCRHILTLELHHIAWVKDGGGNEAENLLVLCPNCHSLHTNGHIPAQAIQTWKSLLVALNSANHGTADLLLVLADDEERTREPTTGSKSNLPFRFTGDGLPALAGLLTSGIIEIAKHYSGGNVWGSSMPSFEIRITDNGRLLVEAWRSGHRLSNENEGSEGDGAS